MHFSAVQLARLFIPVNIRQSVETAAKFKVYKCDCVKPTRRRAIDFATEYAVINSIIEQKLNQNDIEIPLLPEVAGKVVRLTQDPDSDASAMAKLIQGDQTLAGQVMRVANSAAYSPNSNLVSLQQAISRLGINLISDIAMAASVNASLFKAPGFEDYIRFELRFALATGLWAKEVARSARHNVEAAFLAGLMHNIGRPTALQTLIKTAKQQQQTLSKADFLELENQFQQAFGVQLAKEWAMPITVVNAIRYFDDYTNAHDTALHTKLTVAGARLAHHFLGRQEGSDKLSLQQLTSQTVFGELDLYQSDIEALLEKNEKVSASIEAMSS